MDLKEEIKNISIEDKIAFLRGRDFWTTYPLTNINLKSIRLNDGPNGLRVEIPNEKGTFKKSYPATCYPTLSLLACSFDEELLKEVGEHVGKEALSIGVNVLLGPGVNIKRNPLCGRNFEFFSEDPFLAGKLAASYIKGVQSNHVGTSIKHFAGNSSENYRCAINEVIDPRALREIYLKAFEIAVKESQPATIMTAYNKLNGIYCSENKKLINDILREEWGFKGITISDWGAINDPSASVKAGLDLEMPISHNINYFKLLSDYRNGIISEKEIDARVLKVAELVREYQDNKPIKYDINEHHEFAVKAASESIVLLKNDKNLLPIKFTDSALILGEFIKRPRYQGAGSSQVVPNKLTPLLSEFERLKAHYTYLRGYDSTSLKKSKPLFKEALEQAKLNNVVVIFIGQTPVQESEGYDRSTYSLPESQVKLIEEIYKVNKNIVLVIENGSTIDLTPIKDKAKSILDTYLGGEGINEAIVKILYGEVNPSGKLSETYFTSINDSYIKNYLDGNLIENIHKESIFVGYRYFGRHTNYIVYPFGHGLSYSNFKYKNISINTKLLKENEDITVSLDLFNDSNIDGKEVVEVYIAKPSVNVFNAKRELKGFKKVLVKANNTSHVEITIPYNEFSYFDIGLNKWVVESGIYKVEVCKNAEKVIESFEINVEGINISNVTPYKISATQKYFKGDVQNITNEEFKEIYPDAKLFNENEKIIFDYNTTINTAKKHGSKGAKAMAFFIKTIPMVREDKFIYSVCLTSPVRWFRYFAGEIIKENEADLIVKIFNDNHYIKNLFKLLKGINKNVKELKKENK